MTDTMKKLTDLLDDVHFSCGTGELYLAADGSFVNSRGDRMHPYDVLLKVEKLRDALSRGRDYLAVIANEKED